MEVVQEGHRYYFALEFCSFLLHCFTTNYNSSTSNNHKSLIAMAAVVISVPMFPLAGWLADVYVDRYQMISACHVAWGSSVQHKISTS